MWIKELKTNSCRAGWWNGRGQGWWMVGVSTSTSKCESSSLMSETLYWSLQTLKSLYICMQMHMQCTNTLTHPWPCCYNEKAIHITWMETPPHRSPMGWKWPPTLSSQPECLNTLKNRAAWQIHLSYTKPSDKLNSKITLHIKKKSDYHLLLPF